MQLLEPISAILAATHSCSCPAEPGLDQLDAQSHATLALICISAITTVWHALAAMHIQASVFACILNDGRALTIYHSMGQIPCRSMLPKQLACLQTHCCQASWPNVQIGHQIQQSCNRFQPQDTVFQTKYSLTLPCTTADQQQVLLHRP